MLFTSRLIRSFGSLAIVVAAYWLYAWIAVPLIEPAAGGPRQAKATAEQLDAARNSRSHERRLLENWFPPGSWELNASMVLEMPRGKLLLNEYQIHPDGRLTFSPCTMVFLPEMGSETQRYREAVILQTREAELQFDQAPDLRRGQIGNLVAGKLPGQFTIRSDYKQPGPEDDLLIVARDAELIENRVLSPHPIEFRLGANHGSGRDVEIDLGPGMIGAKKEAGGLQLDGIKSFTLKRDVIVFLDAGRGSLLGGLNATLPDGGKPAAAPPTAPASATSPPAQPQTPDELPLRIACQGPFRFNMAALEASFEDRVDVLRLNSGAQSDRLQCQRLSLFFTPLGDALAANDGATTPLAGGRLQPARLEAYGQPVTVEAPAEDVEAVGEILRYNLITREASLEGEHPVMLRRGPQRIVAPRVQFQPSADSRFGKFSATGPGKIEGVDPADATRQFAAQWREQLSFAPDGAEQLFSLRGDAKAMMVGYGELSAAEIHVWVIDPPRGGGQAPAGRGQAPPGVGRPGQHLAARPVDDAPSGITQLGLAPQRMMAVGNVMLDSAPLVGRVDELQIWFQPQAGGRPPSRSSGQQGEELPPPPGAPRTAGPLRPPANLGSSRQRFQVTGKLLQAEVLVGPAETQLGKLRIHERAKVVETQTEKPGERPLIMSGDDLNYVQTNPDNGVLVVSGRPGHVEGRGLALDGATIRLDRGRNELVIDGAGAMTVPVDRDFSGNAVARAQPLTVRWQERLYFDGYMAHFTEQVVCEFDNHQLRTEQLDVTFRDRVNFAQAPGQKQPEMSALACHGPVTLDGRTFKDGQLASIERMNASDLTYDRLTGMIRADGPGEMTVVQKGSLPLGQPPPARPPATANAAAIRNVSTERSGVSEELPAPARPAASDDALYYLHVAFPREMTGILPADGGDSRPRTVQFSHRVKTTYGPVHDWRAKIDADDIDRQLAAGETAAKSVLFMNSDLLTMTELPDGPAGTGSVELEASGNVDIEGINFQRQNFFARADRLTYAAAKKLLILQGDGRAPAELSRQDPYGTAAGRKIFFWIDGESSRIKVDGAQSADFALPGGS